MLHFIILFCNDKSNSSRQKLDKRRLETAHFRYAMLVVSTWYQNSFDQSPLKFLYNSKLESIIIICVNFCFSVAHRCKKAGCGSVLVLDGYMKNHRDVCEAKDAGFVEYRGMPGRVKTGCMETLEQRSKYCSHHKPCYAECCSSDDQQDHSGRVIAMILSKKITRLNTLYKVILLLRLHIWEGTQLWLV